MNEITSIFADNPAVIVAVAAAVIVCIFMIIKKLIKIAITMFVVFIVVLVILTQIGVFNNSDISSVGDKVKDKIEDMAN